MPQFTMYGYSTYQPTVRDAMSDVVADCARETLGVADGSWAHRFLALDPADFRASQDRSERYTVVEVRLFAGRTLEAKKAFYAAMFQQFAGRLRRDRPHGAAALREGLMVQFTIRSTAGACPAGSRVPGDDEPGRPP